MDERYDVMAPTHDRATRDAALARLRREDPVHWDEENQWWLITRHDDLREGLRETSRRSSWRVINHH